MAKLSRAYLACVDGPDKGRVAPIEVQPFSIGRSEDNALVLDDDATPAHLAVVAYSRDAGWRIGAVDRASVIVVNGKGVTDHALGDGDTLVLGSSTWRFSVGVSPAPAQRRPRSMRIVVVLGVLAALGIGAALWGLQTPSRPSAPLSPQEIQGLRVQGISHMKAREWGKALEVFHALVDYDATDSDARDSMAQAEAELRSHRILDESRSLGGKGKHHEALSLLEQIPAASAYGDEARKARGELRREIADGYWSIAKESRREKRWEDARTAAQQVLKWFPDHMEASRMISEADKMARKKGLRKTGDRSSSERPAWVEPYLGGEWEKAKAALSTEWTGSDSLEVVRAREILDRLNSIEAALREGGRLLEEKRLGEAASRWEIASSMEKALALPGISRPVGDLGSRLASIFVQAGEEAFERKAYPDALQNWLKAFKIDSSAGKGLDRLRKIAHDLYEEGYLLEAKDRDAANRKWEEVLKIVPPGDEIFKKAEAKLRGERVHAPAREPEKQAPAEGGAAEAERVNDFETLPVRI